MIFGDVTWGQFGGFFLRARSPKVSWETKQNYKIANTRQRRRGGNSRMCRETRSRQLPTVRVNGALVQAARKVHGTNLTH